MGLFKSKKEEYYFKNPKGSILNEQQYFGISLGLIIGEQNSLYIDSLETGTETTYPLKQMLQNNWRIFERTSALDWLERTMDGKNSRLLYNRLLDICISHGDFSEAEKIDFAGTEFELQVQNDDDDDDDADESEESYQQNYLEILPYLQNLEEIMDLDDGQEWLDGDFAIHADAWDFGRIVFISRVAYSLGYITENEAWSYIYKVTDMAQKLYNNWEDYATSYLLGRAMWCGDDSGGWEDVMAFAADGLYNKHSPWKKLKW
jgi:hypothetical protein